MNILSITGILPITGIRKSNDFLIPLYKAYTSKFPNHNVTFIRLYAFKPFSKLVKQLIRIKSYELHGFHVTMMPYFATWRYANLHTVISSYTSFYFNRRRILRYLKDHAIDIIHAEFIIPDGYLAYIVSKKCNIPYVLTTHAESRYFDKAFSRKMVLKVLQNASFVTPLNFVSDELYRKYGTKNTVIVPHGIDDRFLNAQPSYCISAEINLLTVAALIRYKNIDKVLMAISQLKDQFRIRYTIVGSGPEREYLNELVQKLDLEGIVNFIPKIAYEDIPNEMCKHDIFILPSYFETFGRVLFEAMALGLPTICAKNTGIHGYFKEGEEAFSVVHDDIADIKSKLSFLLKDAELRKRMGLKAKKLMYNYTWEKIAVTFHDLYEKV